MSTTYSLVDLQNELGLLRTRLEAVSYGDINELLAVKLQAEALIRRTSHLPYLKLIANFHQAIVRSVIRGGGGGHVWQQGIKALSMVLSEFDADLTRDRAAAVVSVQRSDQPFREARDVAIVCALRRPELDKVMSVVGPLAERIEVGDPQTYWVGELKSTGGQTVSLVAAAPNQMGLSASAVLATKLIQRFRPRIVCMVGIAAGVKAKDREYGDILCAEHTYDYGAGKVEPGVGGVVFKPNPSPIDVSAAILGRMKDWEASRRHLDAIYAGWPSQKPNTVLRMHVGPLASGAAVVDTDAVVDEIRAHWRKTIGIEMEAYGVHRAVRDTRTPPPEFLCFKSVCDFASGKDDSWQEYAAYTAASLLREFLRDEWETLFPAQ